MEGRRSGNTLYISNLSRRLPVKEVKRRLEQLVSRFSRVSKIKMSSRPGLLGQAFVHLDGEITAELLDRLDGRFFLGGVISACPARSDMCIGRKRPVVSTRTLLVTDIPPHMTKEDLASLFEGLEGIRLVRVKNLAFVDFLSPQEASAAYSRFEDGVIRHSGQEMRIAPSA